MTWVQSLEPTVEGKTQLQQVVSDSDMHCEMPMLPTLTYTQNKQVLAPTMFLKKCQTAPLTTALPCPHLRTKRSDKEKRGPRQSWAWSDTGLGLPRYLDKPVEDFFTIC